MSRLRRTFWVPNCGVFVPVGVLNKYYALEATIAKPENTHGSQTPIRALSFVSLLPATTPNNIAQPLGSKIGSSQKTLQFPHTLKESFSLQKEVLSSPINRKNSLQNLLSIHHWQSSSGSGGGGTGSRAEVVSDTWLEVSVKPSGRR